MRVPMCNPEGVIIERVDRQRLSRLIHGRNVTPVYFGHRRGHRRGEIARLLLSSEGDDSLEDSKRGNPRRYSHCAATAENIVNTWTLKRIPSNTASIFRAVLGSIS